MNFLFKKIKDCIFGLIGSICSDNKGASLMLVVILGSMITIMLMSGVASYAIFESRASSRIQLRDQAFHIAESGVHYYRWHLAHAPNDYWDGNSTGTPGPYVHTYSDKDGNTIGYFSLEIDPPLTGSTIVTIRSTGWTTSKPTDTRTIQARVGFPGLTNFTFLQNANMRFSNTSEVFGSVHSNGGIEFNGTAHAPIESAQETYDTGYAGTQAGVWGTGGPTSFWNYPVPQEDFYGITADLTALKTRAQEPEGMYITSDGAGRYISFQGDGTFDLYTVNSVTCYSGNCYDLGGTTYKGTYDIPENGSIFVEDDVWVDGKVDGRVTIGAGVFPVGTYQNIIIPGDITYVQQGGDDVLGLIAQGSVIVPRNVPDKMTIEAAALAQFGSIYRPYYYYWYSDEPHTSLTFFGSQISYNGGGWKYLWGSTVISGFVETNHIYDGNLRYYPPVGFPVGLTYDLISWEEIQS